jgi:hypothetical protein
MEKFRASTRTFSGPDTCASPHAARGLAALWLSLRFVLYCG